MSVDRVQHESPAAVEVGSCAGGALVRAGAEGAKGGTLRERRGAGHRVLVDRCDGADELRRPDHPTDAPAGHRLGFRQAVDHQATIGNLEERRTRHTVVELAVDLVGDHHQVVGFGEGRQALELRFGDDASGRVRRAVDDYRPSLGGDQCFERGGGKTEAVISRHRVADRVGAGERGNRLVGRKPGVRHQNLVAGIDRGEHRAQQSAVGAHRDAHRIRRVLSGSAFGDELPQLANPAVERIAELFSVEEGARRIDDHRRGGERRFAESEVDGVGGGLLEDLADERQRDPIETSGHASPIAHDRSACSRAVAASVLSSRYFTISGLYTCRPSSSA